MNWWKKKKKTFAKVVDPSVNKEVHPLRAAIVSMTMRNVGKSKYTPDCRKQLIMRWKQNRHQNVMRQFLI